MFVVICYHSPRKLTHMNVILVNAGFSCILLKSVGHFSGMSLLEISVTLSRFDFKFC